jgi:hypothetical protein
MISGDSRTLPGLALILMAFCVQGNEGQAEPEPILALAKIAKAAQEEQMT